MFCSYSKDVGHSHPHILVSKIEYNNVDIKVEAELKLETASEEGKDVMLEFVLFVGRYQIC